MKPLMVLLFVLCAHLCIAQHSPKDSNSSQKIPDRKNIGEGKPRLFNRAAARRITPSATSRPVKISNAFTASAGDTLHFAYASGDLVAVVVFKKQANPHVTVMNLKVINYQDAFMRLTKSNINNKLQYRGMVQHPAYSDALVLKSDRGNEYFETTNQSEVINE